MKKILFGLIATLAMTFTSCKDEAGLPGGGDPVNVAAEVKGVYEGTWTKTLDGTDTVEEGEGTLTLSQPNADEYYVINVEANCATLPVSYDATGKAMNTAAANANINPRYVFFNVVKTDFGNEFNGTIVDKKTISMTYSISVKDGRKQYVYVYKFTGVKK